MVFLRLFSNVKGSSLSIFTKKYYFLGPLEFFENENFDACAPAKYLSWTSKIIPDLWLLYLFCPIKKMFHTPPYWIVSVHLLYIHGLDTFLSRTVMATGQDSFRSLTVQSWLGYFPFPYSHGHWPG